MNFLTPSDPHNQDYIAGLVCSVVGHFVLAFGSLSLLSGSARELEPPVVYSITIESGKELGGIQQVPSKSDSQVAPPRVTAPPNERVAVPDVAAKDAEVSLAQPTIVPTVKPIPTAAPTAQPSAKPTVKATVKPTARATIKPTIAKATPKPQPSAPSKADANKEYQKIMQRYSGESTNAGGKNFGAGAVGAGKGMGGGALRPPEFFRWRELVEIHVKTGWSWPQSTDKLKASVRFEVAHDGAVSNVEIYESSGNREFDESVLRAVQKANPVPEPPSTIVNIINPVRVVFEPER